MKRFVKNILLIFVIGFVVLFEAVNCMAMDTSTLSHNSRYADATKRYGIDVSSHNGAIDWDKVKNSGVEYVFVRMSYRAYRSGTLAEDTRARRNIEGATAADLKVGVYIFSQAINPAEAQEEARYICNQIGNYQIDLPVVMDYEYASGNTGRLYEANLTRAQATENVRAFCETVESAGYTSMLYANKSFLRNRVYADQISENYMVWLANYTRCTDYEGAYSFWQYSSSGTVDGISGNVDCNVWYDFNNKGNDNNTSEDGLRLEEDGSWSLYRNGSIDYAYNDLYCDENVGWWKISGGKVDFDYSDLYDSPTYGWWKISGGKVDFDYSDLYYSPTYGWWKVNGGAVDFGYTDLYDSPPCGWWKVNGGAVDFDYTDLYDSPTYGWWKVNGGAVDFGYTDLYDSPTYGWWKVNGGTVDFGYTDLYNSSTYGWWKINGGAVDFGYTDLYGSSTYGWWKINGGAVDFGYTDLYGSSTYGWWKINGGAVDFGYSGEYNSAMYGQWNVVNGQVIL